MIEFINFLKRRKGLLEAMISDADNFFLELA